VRGAGAALSPHWGPGRRRSRKRRPAGRPARWFHPPPARAETPRPVACRGKPRATAQRGRRTRGAPPAWACPLRQPWWMGELLPAGGGDIRLFFLNALAQGGNVVPELVPHHPLGLGQVMKGHAIPDGGEVGILLPVRKPLAHHLLLGGAFTVHQLR